MRLAVGALILFLLLPSGATVAAADTTNTSEGTISGPAIPIPGQIEQNRVENINDVAGSYGGFQVGHAFWMQANGKKYLVATDTRPKPGVATVSGVVIHPSETEGVSYGLVFAESVEVSQSGPTLSVTEYNQTREQYIGEVVQIRGTQRQIASIQDGEAVIEQTTFGRMAERTGVEFPFTRPPGQAVRELTTQVAADEDTTQFSQAFFRTSVGTDAVAVFPGGYGHADWWVDAPATVTVLVVPDQLITNPYNAGEYLIDVDVDNGKRVSPETIHEQGGELAGEIVTVRGQAIGSQISTQETLLSVAKCAPESVTIPASPPLCIPVPYDVAIHSGAVATADAPNAIVPYAGLSSYHQDVPVTPERGAYRLTGRVVDASELDPRLEGYGLIVYERERIGPLDAAGFASKLEARAENYTNIYQTQLAMSESQYREMERAQDQTPTPTTSPTPSPTATATASPTATTDSMPNQTPTTTAVSNPGDDEWAGIPNTLFDWRWIAGFSDSHPSMIEFLASNRFALLYMPTWLLLIGGAGLLIGAVVNLVAADLVLGVPFGKTEAAASGVLLAAVAVGGVGSIAGFVAAPAATVLSSVGAIGTLSARVYLDRM